MSSGLPSEEDRLNSLQLENWHTNINDASGTSPTFLLTEREAAKWLRLSVKTLRAWRLRKKGPQFVRLGRAVRYRPCHLDAYLRRNTVVTIDASGHS